MSARRFPQHRLVLYVATLVGCLALAYLAWFGLLISGSEEGDIPSASSISFPEGSAIVSAEKECGSGGCWAVFTVRPADGSTSAELESYLSTTFNGRVPGSFLDPRTINFKTAPGDGKVIVTASYLAVF
jgi:hypothetical protein